MKKLILGWLCVLSMFTFSAPAQARGQGTGAEAEAMVKKAVALIKANGKDKALADFNNPKSAYVDRDLYIFVIDKDGTTLANAANAKLVGKNVMEMKDVNQVYFVKKFFETVKDKGKGWVDYTWSNSTTQAMEKKSTYVETIDGLIVGCGIYK